MTETELRKWCLERALVESTHDPVPRADYFEYYIIKGYDVPRETGNAGSASDLFGDADDEDRPVCFSLADTPACSVPEEEGRAAFDIVNTPDLDPTLRTGPHGDEVVALAEHTVEGETLFGQRAVWDFEAQDWRVTDDKPVEV